MNSRFYRINEGKTQKIRDILESLDLVEGEDFIIDDDDTLELEVDEEVRSEIEGRIADDAEELESENDLIEDPDAEVDEETTVEFYCPACGTRLEMSQDTDVCPECGIQITCEILVGDKVALVMSRAE